MAPLLEAILALASGVPLLALGAVLLALRVWGPPSRFLGAFALAWGAQVVAANAGRVLEAPALVASGVLLSYAFLPAASVFLARFVAELLPRRAGLALVAGVSVVSGLAAASLLAAPALVLSPGADGPDLGPLAVPLFIAPFYATLFLASGVAAARPQASPLARGIALSFSLFTSYAAARQLLVYATLPEGIPSLQRADALALAVLFGLALLAHAALGVLAARRRDAGLTAALLLPACWAVAEWAMTGGAVDTVGLWRVAAVASFLAHEALRRSRDTIAELQRLRERLERQNAELSRLNEDLEGFTRAAAHDLRAPLASVRGYADALRDDHRNALGEEGLRMVQRIDRSAEGMQGLVQGLLDLSHAGRAPMQVQRVDLAALARDVVRELRAAEPSRTVDVRIEDGLAAQGDPRLLAVAIRNLLGNAWKYTGRTPDARVEFGAADGAFFVRDNGVGFDPANASRLFQPFARLHDGTFPGHGIGLTTVARVVERHGGRVWAEARPGAGAVFRFTLGDAPARAVPVETESRVRAVQEALSPARDAAPR